MFNLLYVLNDFVSRLTTYVVGYICFGVLITFYAVAAKLPCRNGMGVNNALIGLVAGHLFFFSRH